MGARSVRWRQLCIPRDAFAATGGRLFNRHPAEWTAFQAIYCPCPSTRPNTDALIMGKAEKLKEIEFEISRTQKNKATEYHLGQLKAKQAKLRKELQEPSKGGGGPSEGFAVARYGAGQVALIGFPSVGKSTLLTLLTGTDSESAEYAFTTLTCIPGVIHYNDAKIQLLDLPGIIEGAAEGKGRGRQVIAVCKSSDLLLMVLDATKPHSHKEILTKELEAVGVRLNRSPPDVKITKKKTGGIQFNGTVPLTHMNEKMATTILSEYKIHNADVLIREDITVDDFIDAIEGDRRYLKCLYVYNKTDMCCIEEVDAIARMENSIPISCQLRLNLDGILERIWEMMALVRIYTKKPNSPPDFEDPVVLSEDRGGVTVKSLCSQIHKDLTKKLKYARVWGRSAKHTPQVVGAGHELMDEDVVQIVKNNKASGDTARGRFRTTSNEPLRIADREKKAPLKT